MNGFLCVLLFFKYIIVDVHLHPNSFVIYCLIYTIHQIIKIFFTKHRNHIENYQHVDILCTLNFIRLKSQMIQKLVGSK